MRGISRGVCFNRLRAGGRINHHPSSRLRNHVRSISKIFASRSPVLRATVTMRQNSEGSYSCFLIFFSRRLSDSCLIESSSSLLATLFLRHSCDIESCTLRLSSLGSARFMTHHRGCRRTQGSQHLFKVLQIVAESYLISIGDSDKFKAGNRPR